MAGKQKQDEDNLVVRNVTLRSIGNKPTAFFDGEAVPDGARITIVCTNGTRYSGVVSGSYSANGEAMVDFDGPLKFVGGPTE